MKRILIIDDAATVRLYHRRILEAAGFAVDEAVNGVEALEKAVSTQFNLYLVDVNMPKMDGFTFLRELRELPILQAPAIMISTEAAHADQLQAFVAGANLYMIKPTKPEILLAFVRILVGDGQR